MGGDGNFGYLVADRDAGQGVLVDPSYAPELLTDRAEAQGVTVKQIINTHGHADHTNGNVRAVELTGAPVAAHPEASETPVGLEFVIRPPLEAGPCPGSGRSNAHG